MQFEPTAIPGVILVKPRVFGDSRGYFFESWEARKFAAAGIPDRFVQDNHSHSERHVLRGLHYQLPHAQGKLVRVARGTVFDVAVDIRRSSPTFRKWVGVTLSDENRHMLWVPPGLAHGYLTLSESADFVYRCTDFYAPECEHAILWNDPALGIQWPLAEGVSPALSAKDAVARGFASAELFP